MSRIGANTLALLTSFFSTAVLGVVWYKIITNSMSQEEVGLFVSLFAVGAMLGTFTELGLPQVLVRFGARFDARGNVPRIYRLILFALKVYGSGLVLMSLVLLLGGQRLVDFLSTHLQFGQMKSHIVLLAYLALSSGTIRAINNAGFRGLRQMSWIPLLETLFSLLITISYFTFRHRLAPEMCLIIFWVCSAVVGLLGLVILLRLVKRLSPDMTQESGQGLVKEILPYWQGVAPSGVLLIAVEQVDKILIPAILSLQSNAIFAVISRFANAPRRLLYQPMQVMNPEITRKWEQGRGAELKDDLHLFIKLQLGLGLIMMVPIAILAKPLIALISTPQYVPGAPALWVFCFVLPLLTMHQPMLMMLRAIGRVWHAFGGDALWIGTYLLVGVLLARKYELAGFVSGQVVASVLVLLYTLWAFHRLRLPRPSLWSFGRWLILSITIWGVSVAIGRSLPVSFPWWGMLLTVPVCLLVLNVLLVLGGFLSTKETDRIVALLSGRGGLGRVVNLILMWPRRLKGGGAIFLVAGSLVVSGCGDELSHGCTCDDEIPVALRVQAEAAADSFFARIKAEDARGLLEHAAKPVQKNQDIQSFVGPIAKQIEAFGFPEFRETKSIRAIKLKSGQPIEFPIRCFPVDAPEEKLNLMRHPDQISIVQWATARNIKVAYSMLFWLEEGEWNLGAFEVRPVELYGNLWDDYERIADEQAAKNHHRSAAVLYNMALDLLVPNGWTRPVAIDRIEAKQKRLVVTDIPRQSIETWDVDGVEYEMYKITSDFSGPELGLAVFFRTSEDVTDSLLMTVRTERLANYIQETFPEYTDAFRYLSVVAGGTQAQATLGFEGVFPLRRED